MFRWYSNSENEKMLLRNTCEYCIFILVLAIPLSLLHSFFFYNEFEIQSKFNYLSILAISFVFFLIRVGYIGYKQYQKKIVSSFKLLINLSINGLLMISYTLIAYYLIPFVLPFIFNF